MLFGKDERSEGVYGSIGTFVFIKRYFLAPILDSNSAASRYEMPTNADPANMTA
jgi:hypothetical protein